MGREGVVGAEVCGARLAVSHGLARGLVDGPAGELVACNQGANSPCGIWSGNH